MAKMQRLEQHCQIVKRALRDLCRLVISIEKGLQVAIDWAAISVIQKFQILHSNRSRLEHPSLWNHMEVEDFPKTHQSRKPLLTQLQWFRYRTIRRFRLEGKTLRWEIFYRPIIQMMVSSTKWKQIRQNRVKLRNWSRIRSANQSKGSRNVSKLYKSKILLLEQSNDSGGFMI